MTGSVWQELVQADAIGIDDGMVSVHSSDSLDLVNAAIQVLTRVYVTLLQTPL